MKRFFEWLLSLFKKRIVGEIPICSLRPDPYRPLAVRRDAPGGRKPKPTPTPTPSGQALLFFNFNGATVKSAQWNGGASFYATPSKLTPEDRLEALYIAQAAYLPFNIIVTDNQALYTAHVGPKQQVIITPYSAWYTNPSFTGVAQIGSFGNGTPGFVFEDRLYTRYDFVGDIMVHESGHTLGLAHQSDYTSGCTLVSSYKRGCHMGYPFDSDAQWVIGQTYTCTSIQDDKAILTQKLGLK